MDSQELNPEVDRIEEEKKVETPETPSAAQEPEAAPAAAGQCEDNQPVAEAVETPAANAVAEPADMTPAEGEDALAAGNQEEEASPSDGDHVEETPNNGGQEEEAPKAKERKVYTSKKEVLARVKELAHSGGPLDKEEIDYLKTSFYRIHNAEREAAVKAYLESGGAPENYSVLPDDDEEEFKAEMSIIKEKRAKIMRELEAEKEENLKRKLEIIEKIKLMTTSPEEANKSYQEFKKLQQEWKDIKSVPAAKANELWKNYQLYVEKFYDCLKLNREAREYDFKKNLEMKTKLCEAAERLADEPDVISAFHQLQKLHQEFREIGPVSKDLREEVWDRFKTASTIVYKRHQQHFDELHSREEDNLARKTALCEKAEAIVAQENKTMSDWEKRTKEIIAIQAEWKTIGFAPQKMNVEIFRRFRAACDVFFGRKSDFFKALKVQFKENADKKRSLIEQAKALKDSTDWKATTEKFIALQKEWRTIGAVPKRLSDQLWQEFLSTCNAFFEARNAATAGQRSAERANLAEKRALIAKLKDLVDNGSDDVRGDAQKIVDDYCAVGHVPYKDKEKVYTELQKVLTELSEKYDIRISMRPRSGGNRPVRKSQGGGGEQYQPADSERGKLTRQYEALKAEIKTYENNIGFLSAASKSGSSVIDEINRKVEKLKADLASVKQKLDAIGSENQ